MSQRHTNKTTAGLLVAFMASAPVAGLVFVDGATATAAPRPTASADGSATATAAADGTSAHSDGVKTPSAAEARAARVERARAERAQAERRRVRAQRVRARRARARQLRQAKTERAKLTSARVATAKRASGASASTAKTGAASGMPATSVTILKTTTTTVPKHATTTTTAPKHATTTTTAPKHATTTTTAPKHATTTTTAPKHATTTTTVPKHATTTAPQTTTTTAPPKSTTTTTVPKHPSSTTVPKHAATTTTTTAPKTTTTTQPSNSTTTTTVPKHRKHPKHHKHPKHPTPTTTTTVPKTTTTTEPPKSTTTTVPKTTTTTAPRKPTPKPEPKKPEPKRPAPHQAAHHPAAPHQAVPRPAAHKSTAAPASGGVTSGTSSASAGALPTLTNLQDTPYRLPIPAALLTAHPAWIGEGPAAKTAHRRAARAQPVDLAVPAGTPVSAVTAGRIKSVRHHRSRAGKTSTSTVVLSGKDGATYLYTGVVRPSVDRGDKVTAGHHIGRAGRGGITFAIHVPDVFHQVDASQALQSWSLGMTADIRALPVTTAAGSSARPVKAVHGARVTSSQTTASSRHAAKTTREHVLVVTDRASGKTGPDLKGLLSGRKVKASTLNINPKSTVSHQAKAIRSAAIVTPAKKATPGSHAVAAVHANVIVVALGSTTPTQAAALVSHLPTSQLVLWVEPPAATGHQSGDRLLSTTSAATAKFGPLPKWEEAVMALTSPPRRLTYESVVANHPNLRVETLPSALHVVTSSRRAGGSEKAWSKVGAKVVSSLASSYATTAYRLPLSNPGVSTVLAYAEAQIGKPYVWAGAGPNNFDCSGLTMQAFRRVGINFVHNAYAQYEATKSERVSYADLQPGDLVFFGPNEAGIHHVGIYVGNGEMVDAPETGQDVQIESMAGFGYFAATDPLATLAGASTMSAPASLQLQSSSVGLDQNKSFAKAITDATWGPSQWPYLDALWNRESGWNPAATNPSSGAYGIPQALPASKMSSAGADWATDPYTQIMWGLRYISQRYGTPRLAWAHETSFGWY